MRPYTLIAELTYRCPLHCPYCSNPVERPERDELPTEAWCRVLREAEALGVLQLHLSGGEPLLRPDLEVLVAEARHLGLYSNLVTSGVPLERDRLAELRRAGLDAIQLSIQSAEAGSSDALAGIRCFDRKLEVAGWARALRLPLTINVVLHRDNLGQVEPIVALAERLGARRLELANVQFHGWALANRGPLMPEPEPLARARDAAERARSRLRGQMEILFVLPDYHAGHPRACMDGWGRRFLVVTPSGLALPCHNAHTLPGLVWGNVAEQPLATLWRSPSFERFRGEAWMQEPCRSCDRRTLDFGGCRCQAFHLTGDPSATDPACTLSPHHHRVERARFATARTPLWR